MKKRSSKVELCRPAQQTKRVKQSVEETNLLAIYSNGNATCQQIDVSKIGSVGSGKSLLEQLFPALSNGVESFRNERFRCGKAVLVKGDTVRSDKLACEHMHSLNARRLLEESASPAIEVWLKQAGGGGMESIQVTESKEAVALYGAGHSLYCRASKQLEELLVPRLLQELRYGVRGSTDRFQRGEVETFFSRAGHLTDFHTDFQENFTIMLSGSKKWTFASSGQVAPLRGCTPHYKSKEVAETQLKVLQLGGKCVDFDMQQQGQEECVVTAGDVLYHPAGIWHRVECLEDSVSINISLVACSAADILCGGLQQLLQRDGRFRSALCGGAGESRRRVGEMIAEAQRLLQDLRPEELLPDVCFVDRLGGEEEGEGCPDGGGHDHGGDSEEEDEEEEEEGEEEEEEEEEEGSDDVILTIHDDLDERLDSGERAPPSLDEVKFHVNPLATVVTGRALLTLGWSAADVGADDVYAIHIGYGNEGFESLSRVLLRVNGRIPVQVFTGAIKALAGLPQGASFDYLLFPTSDAVERKLKPEAMRLLAADVVLSLEKCGYLVRGG